MNRKPKHVIPNYTHIPPNMANKHTKHIGMNARALSNTHKLDVKSIYTVTPPDTLQTVASTRRKVDRSNYIGAVMVSNDHDMGKRGVCCVCRATIYFPCLLKRLQRQAKHFFMVGGTKNRLQVVGHHLAEGVARRR